MTRPLCGPGIDISKLAGCGRDKARWWCGATTESGFSFVGTRLSSPAVAALQSQLAHHGVIWGITHIFFQNLGYGWPWMLVLMINAECSVYVDSTHAPHHITPIGKDRI